MRAARAHQIVFALLALASASAAVAHTGGSNGYASIAIDGATARYTLTLWPATLPPEVTETLRLARGTPGPGRDRLLGWIRDKVTLIAEGRRCEAGAGSVPDAAPSVESITAVVSYTCAAPIRDLRIRDDLFDVLGPDYHTLARIDAPGQTTQFAFSTESRETRIELSDAGGRHGIGSFVLLGVEHILTGWDHLLFLVALLLHGGGWLSLAKIITAFTIAHSVTLALAVLDIVRLPDRLVEAVIGLSIAFVAAENVFMRPVVARRWVVSFVFGLVHGFGFSSALRELGLRTQGLLLALFGFNLGVEIGQGLVVAVALPALYLLRGTPWEPSVVKSSSLAILLVGLVLFVERALL
jgi:hypothetical protein